MSKYKLNKPHMRHSNGAGYITKDGHTMFNEDIVRDLDRINKLQEENERLRAELEALKKLEQDRWKVATKTFGTYGLRKRPSND